MSDQNEQKLQDNAERGAFSHYRPSFQKGKYSQCFRRWALEEWFYAPMKIARIMWNNVDVTRQGLQQFPLIVRLAALVVTPVPALVWFVWLLVGALANQLQVMALMFYLIVTGNGGYVPIKPNNQDE